MSHDVDEPRRWVHCPIGGSNQLGGRPRYIEVTMMAARPVPPWRESPHLYCVATAMTLVTINPSNGAKSK